MTPNELITEIQAILGETYKVVTHPVPRPAPQFDVFPEPLQLDPEGNPYGVTFSVRKRDLDKVENASLFAAHWAVAADTDIRLQMERGKASPRVRT